MNPIVIPAQAGLRRQDAEANIGEADGPQGGPQDAASNPVTTAPECDVLLPDPTCAIVIPA